MSGYQTEEEQVEALKRWWKENGTSVIAGVVIGLGGVFGWQAWNNYQDRVGSDASLAFNQLVSAQHLIQANLKLEQGEPAAARSQLEWAMGQANNESLKQLAQLNLARILLSDGDLDGAEKLATVESGGFAGEFAQLRGDIAAKRGDKQAAFDAYTLAMTQETSNRNLLQMKLDDLALAQP
ncbi:MAG: tetratricopeptide repeat protein [Candidatus Thiodiazotropha sp.]